MTKYEKLRDYLLNNFIRDQDVKRSISDLLVSNRTYTGYSNRLKKKIWTNQVRNILSALDIPHISDNDAPRGGASGEYVEVTSPAFIKEAKQEKKRRDLIREIEYWSTIERNAMEQAHRRTQQEEHAKRMNKIVEDNIDKFMDIDLVSIVKKQYPT